MNRKLLSDTEIILYQTFESKFYKFLNEENNSENPNSKLKIRSYSEDKMNYNRIISLNHSFKVLKSNKKKVKYHIKSILLYLI